MAYSRWGNDSHWYIFWESGSPESKANERLAIWHADERDGPYAATYREVRDMLSANDFHRIPGYSNADREAVAAALSEFVADVDLEHERRTDA